MDRDSNVRRFVFVPESGGAGRVQATAALLWVIYGVTIHALPVVVANVVVAGVAVGSSLKLRKITE